MNNILQNIFSHDFKKIAIMESDGGVITYGELYENALGVANDLFEKNCSENVILYTGNTIEFAIGLLGIWLCGKVAVPVDIRTQPAHMKNILFNLKSNTIIYSEISPKESLLAKWCVFPRQKAVKKINLKNCINEIAFIFPTSGTTDVSKNVVLGISGIDEECKAIKMAHGFDLQTREIVIVPITSSCGCLGQLVPVLYSGGSIVLYKGSFNVPKLIRTIHTYNPNILVCTSSILSLLLNASALKMDDLKSIERIISAGEKSDINTLNILKERFNIQSVTQAYGLTETSSQLSGSSLDINAPLESVGKNIEEF